MDGWIDWLIVDAFVHGCIREGQGTCDPYNGTCECTLGSGCVCTNQSRFHHHQHVLLRTTLVASVACGVGRGCATNVCSLSMQTMSDDVCCRKCVRVVDERWLLQWLFGGVCLVFWSTCHVCACGASMSLFACARAGTTVRGAASMRTNRPLFSPSTLPSLELPFSSWLSTASASARRLSCRATTPSQLT